MSPNSKISIFFSSEITLTQMFAHYLSKTLFKIKPEYDI
jgi:hypothetical protein